MGEGEGRDEEINNV